MSPQPTAADTPSEGLSRRLLMRQAAAVGAAGLASTLVTGATPANAATTAATATTAAEGPAPTLDEPMVVHLRDVRSGHLDLFSGERHQRIQDPELAAALVRALSLT
ncbi:hypothetical protein [Kitasatospora viridis]|uniref:Secreted protein n=1 Tax=Kitasatospora viridis TaxID=281105 RepID=A0A561UCD5_9ACTN|nr:hypothetical protein [Kitasatospora viridis]TWF97017.1 hypothetical protein FHX73_11792 [Kitasatospora viridis]